MGFIYLVDSGGRPVRLTATDFENEGVFQEVVASIPDLLPGDQIDAANPRRWLLIDREVSIPDKEAGGGRWSVDHLFIDQDAIPTLVEIKRHTDTRIRREVVGQMLDYASNAEAYWPESLMSEVYEARCKQDGIDANEHLVKFLGDGVEPAEFWESAYDNLKSGRVRLVFVADGIPPELQRIVEFLNAGMNKTEVVAVEIRRYVGEGVTVHVPRVVGHSIAAQGRARSSESRSRWDEVTFFDHANDCSGGAAAKLIRGLYDACVSHGLRIDWGTGTQHGSFSPKFPGFGNIAPFTVRCDGQFSYKGSWLAGERSSPEARHLKDVFDRHFLGIKILSKDEMDSDGVEGVPWDRWRGRVDELATVVGKVVSDLELD